jgi:hypothetical protein
MVRSVQIVHLSCTDTNIVSKEKKWDSTQPTSPKSSIGCIQNDYQAHGTSNANRAPILRQD